MRFLTLLKKELREALPWLLLTAIIFLFVGSLLLWSDLRKERFSNDWSGWSQNPFSRNVVKSRVPISREGRFGYVGKSYSLVKRLPLSDFGSLLVFSSAGLGLVLAVRQFLVPSFFKTWSFTIHRSMPRAMILLIISCVKSFIAGLSLSRWCNIISVLFGDFLSFVYNRSRM